MSWDKVYLLEGEPYYIDLYIDSIKEENNFPNVQIFDNSAHLIDLKNALTAFNFFEEPDIIIIKEPNADILNVCNDFINKFTCSSLILTCQYNSFDGRQSFVSKAKKNNKLIYLNHIKSGDSVANIIKEWCEDKNLKLNYECLNWLNKNCPTRLAKIKDSNNVKKDTIIVDLLMLFNQLNKIKNLYDFDNKAITTNDLINYCNFRSETDIWSFIDKMICGDISYCFNYFDKNQLTTNDEGILWVIASQIELYLQVCGVSKSLDQLQDDLTLKSMLNTYYNDDLQINDFKPKPAINPYRLKMAQQTCRNLDIESLSIKYQNVINSIQDLRAGLPPEIVSGYLSLALSGKTSYETSLVNV